MARLGKARLYGIGTCVPPSVARQEDIHRFMSRLARATLRGDGQGRALRLLDAVYPASGIRTRHSVLTDYLADDPRSFRFYPPNWELEPFPTTAERMSVYEARSVELAAEAAGTALERAGAAPEDVTHLIVATCTGFFAPGPDVALVERLGLSSDVARTLVTFMGCYAGFSAMRDAAAVAAGDPEAVVLVASVELCSLHFQKRPRPDFIIANSLFSDGAGAAVFASPGRLPGRGVAFLRSKSRVAPGTRDRMSWRIGATGFEMRLAKEVPSELGSAVPPFVAELLAGAGVSRGDRPAWAIHPGGPRILSEVARALGLDDAEAASGLKVLAERGNMSSATIFFVLEEALNAADDAPVVALGFGPGLTLEGAVLARA